jgi:hypothetical protein
MKYKDLEIDFSWVREFCMALFYVQTEYGFYVKRFKDNGRKYCKGCFRQLPLKPNTCQYIYCDHCQMPHNNPDYVPQERLKTNWKTS